MRPLRTAATVCAVWACVGAPAGAAVITNQASLRGMSHSGSHELANDIVLDGTWTEHQQTFSGTLDGKGFTISGLNYTPSPGTVKGGIFNTLSGTVKNLTLVGTVNGVGGFIVGGLAGSISGGTVSNVTFEMTVSGNEQVGILTGLLSGSSTITSVTATGTVSHTGINGGGGLVGRMTGGTLYGCVSSATVDGDGFDASRPGGLVGDLQGGTIRGSIATGNVLGRDVAGGLAGAMTTGVIEDSYYRGTITLADNFEEAGGLVGHATGGSIRRSYAAGSITAGNFSRIGGLVGMGNGSAILSNCFSVCDVSDSNEGGGLIGITPPTLHNNWWFGAVTNGLGNPAGTPGGMARAGAESNFYDNSNSPLDTWNFSSIWTFPEGTTGNGLPILRFISFTPKVRRGLIFVIE